MRAGFRPREARIRVCVPARMRAGEAWTDVTILNISSRGLMARVNAAPPVRSYVEIRRGAEVVIVGKVVWHDDRHFGIRTQDRIDIEMLGGVTKGACPPDPAIDRRTLPRGHRPDPAEAFERSRQKAAIFQFVVLTACGVAGAILVASAVRDMLGAPLAIVASHLG
ncbi:PilZ domain-containing protein [Sphingomonas sp. BIUV-7]|uniref:PilZ domain-containing protein n=1 Tax=Sphingomonas natans TaxID=3063330 RepID=A0ABT8Y5B6_9SPHN|nr:PilZ domain-containing protein [Sphingomonas sp. BIUV-7]